MRIGVVGGVFGHSPEYRSRVLWTPETVLVEGLRARGHEVAAIGHAERFRASDFDVLHVHHLASGALRAATDGSSTPFVFTMHVSTPEHARAASFVMRRADRIVALSSMEAETIERTYSETPGSVAVIPNGIDPTAFSFQQPTTPDRGPWRILFVGQLTRKKGVDRLFEAMTKLPSYRTELELRYHVSSAEDEAYFRARAAELQIADNVWFAGATQQGMLKERYWAAHILVLPSLSGEALPSVLTEGMLAGCYPVATDVGGVREQLAEFGVVVPRSTAEDIAAGISQAIETYDAHCRRARAMRDYAESRFSIESMVSSHEDLYRRLASIQGVPRRLRGSLRWGTRSARWPLDMRTRIRAHGRRRYPA
jgi:glycosyltransferase involved in cell wall biosynthesis